MLFSLRMPSVALTTACDRLRLDWRPKAAAFFRLVMVLVALSSVYPRDSRFLNDVAAAVALKNSSVTASSACCISCWPIPAPSATPFNPLTAAAYALLASIPLWIAPVIVLKATTADALKVAHAAAVFCAAFSA